MFEVRYVSCQSFKVPSQTKSFLCSSVLHQKEISSGSILLVTTELVCGGILSTKLQYYILKPKTLSSTEKEAKEWLNQITSIGHVWLLLYSFCDVSKVFIGATY